MTVSSFLRTFVVLGVSLFCLGTATASDLPTFAQSKLQAKPVTASGPAAPEASAWAGLTFGTEVFATSLQGHKGVVGGGVALGIQKTLPNNVVWGAQVATGTAPMLFGNRAGSTFDYARASGKLGYEMGRFTPYVSSGIVLAKPTSVPGQGYVNATSSVNDLFGGSRDVKTSAHVGTGVDIAVTDNLKVGLGASVGAGRAGALAGGW